MAIITPPAAFPLRRIEWTLRQPAQVNRSEWTGARQVVGLPGAPRWSARAEFVPIIGETNVRQWRAFFASLRGPVNTFWLHAAEGPQHALSITPRVNGAGQSGRTMTTDGWPNSTTVLPAGAYVSIASTGQLLMLTAPITSNGSGQATISFEPALRISPADNAVIESIDPVCHVALSGDTIGWSVDPGQLYGLAFDVEEVDL